MMSTDPLSLMIASGAAIISALASVVLLLLFARLGRTEKSIEDVCKDLQGKEGTWTRLTRLEEWGRGAEERLQALARGGLSREIFERETSAQNRRLEELKANTRELDEKLDRLDRKAGYQGHPSPPPYPKR